MKIIDTLLVGASHYLIEFSPVHGGRSVDEEGDVFSDVGHIDWRKVVHEVAVL